MMKRNTSFWPVLAARNKDDSFREFFRDGTRLSSAARVMHTIPRFGQYFSSALAATASLRCKFVRSARFLPLSLTSTCSRAARAEVALAPAPKDPPLAVKASPQDAIN
jgi:hypothetical protein